MKNFKRISTFLITILCLSLVTGCSSKENSEETTTYSQDFILINNTGVLIDKVYISPNKSNDWGDTIMQNQTLPTGSQLDVKFSAKEKSQYWDIKITDIRGTAVIWEKLDLFSVSEVTLNFENGEPTATYK